ncbi:MAG: acetyl-CoA C-acyltransferase [Syntrophaceae bacterium]|nr:acetyl-CoA C-acyltransferase [Syntrophaceae bacterium]
MRVKEIVMASACRTPIGDFLGSLKNVSARDLAITAGKEAIRRAGISPDVIDEICMGEVYGAMQGSLPARQVGMRIGLPFRSIASVVNQNCASGMRALEIAAHNLMLGKTEIALVVGVESMSNTPYLIPKARMGYRMNAGTIEDHMIHDGLVDELVPGHMGVTAENIAAKYGITRQECDELALLSHQRACKAICEGKFKDEIISVEIPTKKGTTTFDTDEHPRENANLESMAKLKPAFIENGVVTAANASGMNDAASAIILMTKDKALDLGIHSLMKLINICSEGVDPKVMGLGPAVAIPKCLIHSNMRPEDVDYWEINEAFAAQFLGCERMLKEDFGISIDMKKTNLNGSGIALGHPIGCTALRIIVSLYYEMARQGFTVGGASLCVGGGPGMASLWTRDI